MRSTCAGGVPGRWKTYGSWGFFYDIFKMNLARGWFGGDYWQEYWYTLETSDWTTLLDPVGQGNCPPACPASTGRVIRRPYDFRLPGSIDPDIKPMRSQELSFGLEHQLSAVAAVSARYIRKSLDRGVEDTGSFTEGWRPTTSRPRMRQGSTSTSTRRRSTRIALTSAR